MSLNNVKLPDVVLADLYRQTLIQHEGLLAPVPEKTEKIKTEEPVPPPAPVPTAANEPAAYKTLGNNRQNISIVVNFPDHSFLPETDLQFLTKMLGACKLNMGDVAIVNHASAPVTIDRLKTQLQPRYILLFGVEPGTIQLPMSFPPFKEQAYAGSTYLFTPSLSLLNQENEEAKLMKRKLWDCLKRMFGV